MNTGSKTQDTRSHKELKGVHPTLVNFVSDMSQSFTFVVTDGLRTIQEQAELVTKGASQVLNSKHLIQKDGYGHAVDITLFLNGKPRWELPLYYRLALEAQEYCRDHRLGIRWGGCWVNLRDHEPRWETTRDVEISVAKYSKSKKAVGKPPLIDAVHFELIL